MKTVKRNIFKALVIVIAVFAFFPTSSFAGGNDISAQIVNYLNEKGYEVYSVTQSDNGQWIADTQNSYNTMIIFEGTRIVALQDMRVSTPVAAPIIQSIVGVVDGI